MFTTLRSTLFFLIFSLCFLAGKSQVPFPEKCLGTWEGMLMIYQQGQLRDSVKVIFTVAKTDEDDRWAWKKEYVSEKYPMVKDYELVLKDAEKGYYITDEGDNIQLTDYLFGNKLYSVFETGGILLTSTYEMREEELIFEVTSGKKLTEDQEVNTFSVSSMQKAVFTRSKED
ncbi:MAG: hypothetical protein AAGC85_11205 [Bacteroidota bacterium]